MGNSIEVVVAIQVESKIVLIAVLHELLQFLLALLGKDVAAKDDGEHEDKIA